jgi:hypothetical protein
VNGSLRAFGPVDHENLDRRSTAKNRNAQSLIELFTLLMAGHPATKYFRFHLDNARYHHTKVLQVWIGTVPQKRGGVFEVKPLPAYAPNRNVIERLGQLLRKEALPQWQTPF